MDTAARRGAQLLADAHLKIEQAHELLNPAAAALVRAGNGPAIRAFASQLPNLPAAHPCGFLRAELLRLAADIERGLYAADQLSRFAF